MEEIQLLADFSTSKEIILQSLHHFPEHSKEILSGFAKLDAVIGGFSKGELTVILTKPGHGKTSFLISLTLSIALNQHKTIAIFSPERSSAKLVQRMIESEIGVSLQKINQANFAPEALIDIQKKLEILSKADIFIDDSPAIYFENFEKKCRMLKQKYGIKQIFIDSIDLFSGHVQDVQRHIDDQAYIFNELKRIAQELNVSIVAFSQMLNTANLHKSNDIPGVDNVPSFITSIADMILLLHRNTNPETMAQFKDLADLILVKHPNIQVPQHITLKFIEKSGKFADFE